MLLCFGLFPYALPKRFKLAKLGSDMWACNNGQKRSGSTQAKNIFQTVPGVEDEWLL